MKKTLLFVTLLLFCFYVNYGQESIGGTPPSFAFNELYNNIDVVTIPPPDLDALAIEDADRAQKSEAYRIGVVIPVDLNPENSGTWIDLSDNSGKIWQLTVKSAGAIRIGLVYRNFYLPSGARLFLYSKDKQMTLGAYSSINNNNNEDGSFTTESVKGDEFTIELFLPDNTTEQAILNISELAYFYRGDEYDSPAKASDPCEVDINCPEGANWQDEKKGICRLDIKSNGSWFNCSGSLMNNTKNDCTPYVLLADHCIYNSGYPTVSDCNAWVFRFHYERTTCGGSTNAAVKTMTGCTLRAHDTYGQSSTGSDFSLVQINATIPTSHNIFYIGWDRTNTASTSGVGIHHPSADVMKISTYTTTLTSVTYGSTSSHWKVIWAATTTNHGVTEQGSSGSALFNAAGRIIGTLTGGSSYCSTPTQPDYYGKVYKHWDLNGSTAAKQLKPWLDPNSSGVNFMNGSATCTPSSIAEEKLKYEKMLIYPSPASNEVFVEITSVQDKLENLSIYNVMGIRIKNISVINFENGKAVIDISDLTDGVYFLSVEKGKVRINGEFVKIK